MLFGTWPNYRTTPQHKLSDLLAHREELWMHIDLALDVWNGIGRDDALVERLNELRAMLLDVQKVMKLWEATA